MIIKPSELKLLLLKTGMPADGNLKANSSFSWQELLKNQKEIPSIEVLNNLLTLANALYNFKIRLFQGRPIIITSGWRSVNYNRSIGGAINSYHVKGMALDFVVEGFSVEKVNKLLNPLWNGGIECSTKEHPMNWIHLDMGSRRRFDKKGNTVII